MGRRLAEEVYDDNNMKKPLRSGKRRNLLNCVKYNISRTIFSKHEWSIIKNWYRYCNPLEVYIIGSSNDSHRTAYIKNLLR